jgi:hypothetical protein
LTWRSAVSSSIPSANAPGEAAPIQNCPASGKQQQLQQLQQLHEVAEFAAPPASDSKYASRTVKIHSDHLLQQNAEPHIFHSSAASDVQPIAHQPTTSTEARPAVVRPAVVSAEVAQSSPLKAADDVRQPMDNTEPDPRVRLCHTYLFIN